MVDKTKVLLITTLVFLAVFIFLVLFKLHGPSLLDMESIFLEKVIIK